MTVGVAVAGVAAGVAFATSVGEGSLTIRVSVRSRLPPGPVRWLPVLDPAVGGGGVAFLELPLFAARAFFGAILFVKMPRRV